MNVRPDRTTKYTKSGLISGKTNAIKKAIVQVQEGETIDFTTISKIENVSKKIKPYYPRSAI
jgi:ribosomal protein L23